MTINAFSIPIWITAILVTSLATVTYWGSKKLSSKTFAFTMYAVAIYTGGSAFFLFQDNYQWEIIGIRAVVFSGIIIATLIYLFTKAISTETRPSGGMIFLLLLLIAGSFYSIFFSNYIVGDPIALKNIPSGILWGWHYGQYYIIYIAIILLLYISGAKILLSTYKKSTDSTVRGNLILNLLGLVIGVVSPMIFLNILPQNGNFDLIWLGHTTSIVWVSIISFSLFKFNKMSVRIVITEVLVIAMSIAAFTNIFIGDFLGMAGKIFIFLSFSILGIYLIRSSISESEQKEKLADLNIHLQQKVEEQTREIRASYQVERNARLELEKVDEAKNQFILITQHHLRTPITSIKWQLEAIMSDTYGVVSPELKKAMGDMGESVGRLNHLIDSLLSISALRSGIETLKKSSVSIKTIVDDIVNELNKDIGRKHIKVEVADTQGSWPQVAVDKDRMREALFVIIENAVRYNVENGFVKIAGRATENSFELVVENSGSELSSEDRSKIFAELFYRSSQAQTSHPTGVGIGLSMAQAIIEAHKGTISLSSRKDKDGGVKVVVTLPY